MAKARHNTAKRLCETYAGKRGLSAFCFETAGPYSGQYGNRLVFRAMIAEPHELGDIIFATEARSRAAAWKSLLAKIAEAGVSPEELAIDGDLI